MSLFFSVSNVYLTRKMYQHQVTGTAIYIGLKKKHFIKICEDFASSFSDIYTHKCISNISAKQARLHTELNIIRLCE